MKFENIKKIVLINPSLSFFCAICFSLFFVSCEITDNSGDSPLEHSVVSYIQKDTLDKSLSNLRILKEIGSYFGNTNYSLDHPTDGYLSSKTDNLNKITEFTFDPKIDFEKVDESGYLIEDLKNGKLTNYKIVFKVDRKNKIVGKRSFLTYSNSGVLEFDNDSVPDISNQLNNKIVSVQRKVKEIEDAKELETQNLNKKLNQMDNSSFWNEFDPIVKERIYNLIEEKNCAGLQREFNTTSDLLEKKQNSGLSGSKHLELMNFIDEKMKKIKCY